MILIFVCQDEAHKTLERQIIEECTSFLTENDLQFEANFSHLVISNNDPQRPHHPFKLTLTYYIQYPTILLGPLGKLEIK